MLMLIMLSSAPVAARDAAAEQLVKATYLFKFLSYVEWPPGTFDRSETPLTIGVAAPTEVAEMIGRAVAGKTVQGRKLEVMHVPGSALPALHLLFVSASTEGSIAPALLTAARGKPILTVVESERDFKRGGVINFVVVDDKVRFDVSLGNLESTGIKLGVRLLGVARSVHGANP